MSSLPSAEELQEHLFEEKCEHGDKPHCDQCTFDHLYTFRREVLEAAAEVADDAFAAGESAGEAAAEIRKLKEKP